MIILGIDPGLRGALAFYDTAEKALVLEDMPIVQVFRNGKKKDEVSAQLLSHIIAENSPDRAFMERVNAMPGQGVSSVFSFGRSSGVVEGALAAFDIPTTLITPVAWMKELGMRAGKDGSRERAMQLFPAYASLFGRKKDDGRSDAALIAWYGYKTG